MKADAIERKVSKKNRTRRILDSIGLYCAAHDLTFFEFEEMCGLGKYFISKHFRYRGNITETTLYRICHATGTRPIDWDPEWYD